MYCLQNFTIKEILSNHKKQYLLINGCEAVNYESGIITFTNHNKQIPILFKIYADTECSLKCVNSYEGEHTIKHQEHILNSIRAQLVCIDIDLLYLLLFLKVNILLINLSHGY